MTASTERCVEPTPRMTVPAPAIVLGIGGLVPFAAAAGIYAFGPPRWAGPALLALVTFAAAVLSFLGGVRWGAEVMRTNQPTWPTMFGSVLPALVGWALLAAPFATPEWQLSGFIAAFLGCWLWDLRSGRLPPWYERIRTLLTFGVVLALGVALEKSLSAV